MHKDNSFNNYIYDLVLSKLFYQIWKARNGMLIAPTHTLVSYSIFSILGGDIAAE
jgi:hypothetical protein